MPSWWESGIPDIAPRGSITRPVHSIPLPGPSSGEPHVHKKYGDRAFSVVGPKLWNGLPLDIRNSNSVDIFKKNP